jgi:SAM-dependent methyltransferase
MSFPSLDDFASTLRRCEKLLCPDERALALRDEVNSRSRIEVFDYHGQAETFTRAFAIRNSLKCLASLIALGIDRHEYRTVADLGCGSGAFSLAFAYMARRAEIGMVAVDESSRQLALLGELLSHAGFDGALSTLEARLPVRLPTRPELTLSSFWFCENQHVIDDPVLFDLMVGRELVVVDYEEVILRIRDGIPDGYHVMDSRAVDVHIPASLVDMVGQPRSTAHCIHIGRN